MGTRQVEQLGLRLLSNQLTRDGLCVETRNQDALVDLLVWTDEQRAPVPFQMLAASRQKFGVYRKHATRPGLVMAYVWDVEVDGAAVFYAMRWHEAQAIADRLGWTRTRSWQDGGYMTTSPSARVKSALLDTAWVPESGGTS